MMSSRVSSEYVVHSAISSRVRPQPKQKLVFMSIEQTSMQGDAIGGKMGSNTVSEHEVGISNKFSKYSDLIALEKIVKTPAHLVM